MKSSTDTTELLKSRKKCRGQVFTEYVVFLAISLALIGALVFLMRAVGAHGEKSVERIGYSVP